MNQVTCPKCHVAQVPTQKTRMITAGGIAGALLFLIGLVVVFINTIVGLMIIILSVIISYSGAGKKTVMVCSKCGKQGRTL